jgi:sirohydrochlorin cobaltochelatase
MKSHHYMFTILLILASAYVEAKDKTGVLVLAHGGSKEWNTHVQNAVQPLEKNYAVEIAFGMATPSTMQKGIDNLEARGVTRIVVVPLFISSHSFIVRQTEYLLGKRKDLADPAMVMDHSPDATASAGHASHNQHSGHGGHHDHAASDNSLPRLSFRAEVILTNPLDAHPLVAEILQRRISELSTKPSNETVIIVAHGPNPEDDNVKWLSEMERLTKQINAATTSNPYKNIFAVTVRDDADEAIYNQAKENLRAIVRQAGSNGDVIVVPLFLSSGSAEKKVVKRLEGLNYKWNGKTLLPDNGITRFIEESVAEAIRK